MKNRPFSGHRSVQSSGRSTSVQIGFDAIFGFQQSAPRTPLWAQNAHPRTRIYCPSGVEGGIMYTDVGCNVYFDFSLCLNERKITSHSGHACKSVISRVLSVVLRVGTRADKIDFTGSKNMFYGHSAPAKRCLARQGNFWPDYIWWVGPFDTR